MYIRHAGTPSVRLSGERKIPQGYYPTEDALNIVSKIEADTGDTDLRQSIHFSTGIISRLERQLSLGCTIIADSKLVYSGINRDLCGELPVRIECFMDDPSVVNYANQKRTTRAEIAVERALAIPGPKLLVVGSAPMALNRLLQIHAQHPLREVSIVAAANGFANIVELKERIWESGLPCIVVRGRKGGANSAIAITNALIASAASKK
ncbi:MAG: precorrin-8X methylmutase [Clostridia bacterium]|nr:precorrin-8X methylmutase [Clostridia bacterium]